MKLKLSTILMLGCFSLSACAGATVDGANLTGNNNLSDAKIETKAVEAAPEKSEAVEPETVATQTKQPKNVRDFFNILPQKYFLLEGCEPAKDKNCDKARRKYIKTFLEIEDAANGYWKSGCDGAQGCLRMALFKRSDASYIVAVHTLNEADEVNYFLEYKNGRWSDIAAQIVPDFSDKNIYELPQKGTTVAVFKKNFPEPEFSERGAKIYDLVWSDGKFTRQK